MKPSNVSKKQNVTARSLCPTSANWNWTLGPGSCFRVNHRHVETAGNKSNNKKHSNGISSDEDVAFMVGENELNQYQFHFSSESATSQTDVFPCVSVPDRTSERHTFFKNKSYRRLSVFPLMASSSPGLTEKMMYKWRRRTAAACCSVLESTDFLCVESDWSARGHFLSVQNWFPLVRLWEQETVSLSVKATVWSSGRELFVFWLVSCWLTGTFQTSFSYCVWNFWAFSMILNIHLSPAVTLSDRGSCSVSTSLLCEVLQLNSYTNLC